MPGSIIFDHDAIHEEYERLTGSPKDDLHWLAVGIDVAFDIVEETLVTHSNGNTTLLRPSHLPYLVRLTDAEGIEIVRRLLAEGKITNVRKFTV